MTFSSLYKNSRLQKKKGWNILWRFFEPIVLGSIANILVNAVFNPLNYKEWWSLSEFVVAIGFCTIITELNRFLETKIEKYYSWTLHPIKRFICNLICLTICVAFVLNIIGNIYLLFIGDTFYSLEQMLTINISTFFVALILTIFRWTTHFFKKWKSAQTIIYESNVKFNSLVSNLNEMKRLVTLRKKSKDYQLSVNDIRIAALDFGVVKVFMNDGDFYIFHGSLSKLASLLPESLFFPVRRNMIVHRDAILSLSSGLQGKIDLEIRESSNQLHKLSVSRLKASSFRKWFNNSSGQNL